MEVFMNWKKTKVKIRCMEDQKDQQWQSDSKKIKFNFFIQKNWASSIVDNYVKFSFVSADGEGGFPGEVWFDARFKLDGSENILSIEYKAITDKPTPINMTNHFYFNLNGRDSVERIYNHFFKINSDKILELNSDNTVNGSIRQVDQSKYDFRDFTSLADRIQTDANWPENGFDNYFIAKNSSDLSLNLLAS